MRAPALIAALALAAAPALAQPRSGAATWPINTYLNDVDIARADAAIAQAADGPLGTAGAFNNPGTGVNGTVIASDETRGRRQPTCRTFQVTAFLPPEYQTHWVNEPRWFDPFRVNPGAVERRVQVRPPSTQRFAWTACRATDGQWVPRQ